MEIPILNEVPIYMNYGLFALLFIVAGTLIHRFTSLVFYSASNNLPLQSRQLLIRQRLATREIRGEVVRLWLKKQRKQLAYGIRLLKVIAINSPLIGFLATIIQLINLFDSIAVNQKLFQPSIFAESVSRSMESLALGISISILALAGAHLFQLWIDNLILSAEKNANLQSLEMDGISTEALA